MQQMRAMQMMNLGMFGADPTGRPMRRGRRAIVKEWERGLLFRRGRLLTELPPGPHRRWVSGFSLRLVDMRPWVVSVPIQEVPTADGATVKISVSGQARITDPKTYVTAAREPEQALYLAVQVALRELVATATVDDLLAGRADAGGRLLAAVQGVAALGIAVDQLELKDIVLPGELKRAQAEVLVARAQGTASLERARGETAALRSLANAARMAADNPALLQLRLLHQLDASSGHTVVVGTSALSATGVPLAAETPAAPAPKSSPTKRAARQSE